MRLTNHCGQLCGIVFDALLGVRVALWRCGTRTAEGWISQKKSCGSKVCTSRNAAYTVCDIRQWHEGALRPCIKGCRAGVQVNCIMAAHGSRMALFAPLLVRFPGANLRISVHLVKIFVLTISTLTFLPPFFYLSFCRPVLSVFQPQKCAKLLYLGAFLLHDCLLSNVFKRLKKHL